MNDDTGGQEALQRLLERLNLERLDDDLFLGDPGSRNGGPMNRLFGGLVAAQSVMAAYRTVDDPASKMHSLHAYFLRPGKHEVPIRYLVYRIRDGRTFTTRDVVAYQSGEAIFNLSSSFSKPEEGVSHQGSMPPVPPPEDLPPDTDWGPDVPKDGPPPPWVRNDPIEQRAIVLPDTDPGDAPVRRVWMRLKGTLPDDPALHTAMLAFASDRGLIGTVRRAHSIARGGRTVASLDHAMWFHHQPRFDDWLLYTSVSPVAHAARALIFGELYRRDGTLAVSVAQEGLIRA